MLFMLQAAHRKDPAHLKVQRPFDDDKVHIRRVDADRRQPNNPVRYFISRHANSQSGRHNDKITLKVLRVLGELKSMGCNIFACCRPFA